MGLARKHRASPVAALRAEIIFATPVLYSGMASLLLTRSEIDILAQHVKETTQNLLKLHSKTPEPVIFFLAGRLPGEAQLHLKQLSLFGMICRLPGSILHNIAVKLLTTLSQSSRNWFSDIRNICYQYNLPHPLTLLKDQPPKEVFKAHCKTNITDFWQKKLRDHSLKLHSLKFFKPQFMSLSKPHPMLSWASTSYQVNKCVVVSRMLSGRFRCGSLLRHFYKDVSGLCDLCGEEVEDLPHILLPRCPCLQEHAQQLMKFALESLSVSEQATTIFTNIISSEDDQKKVQLFLDPSVIPEIICETQKNKNDDILHLFLNISTTWCYSINRTRIKLIGN